MEQIQINAAIIIKYGICRKYGSVNAIEQIKMLPTCLHKNLLTRLVRVCLVDQQKQILDYLLKLLQQKNVTYCAKAFHF